MIRLPRTLDEARSLVSLVGPPARVRAGGTDLQERRAHGLAPGPLVDLRDVEGLDFVEQTDAGGLRIGARVTVRQLQHSPLVAQGWPGLAMTARGLATPQIRARATVGGNLLKDVRCWYYHTPEFTCLKKGGSACLARQGEHSHHACVDLGACAAPHPSTLALAFLALGAQAHLADGRHLSMDELYGDARDPTRCHTLGPRDLLEAIELPPSPGWHGAYHRTIQRARAEWPLVEAYVGLYVVDGRVMDARVAMGGIANRPLRLEEVEAALVGRAVDPVPRDALALAEQRATGDSGPLPQTAYKVPLMTTTLVDTFRKATQGPTGRPLPVGHEPADPEAQP